MDASNPTETATDDGRLILDGRPIAFTPGDSVLVALIRAGQTPPGCLCLGGDCPNCLVIVDGVAYVRACQTPARPGLLVDRQPVAAYPPLPPGAPLAPPVAAHHSHTDVVVVGAGASGRAAAAAAKAAGQRVIVLDAGAGQEVVGLYHGPMAVARTSQGMRHVHARDEIVVATGAAELQPVVPGSHLTGLLTTRAAERLAAAGVDLGRVVAVGAAPAGIAAAHVVGDLTRFAGVDGRLTAVVTRDDSGNETRYPADTAVLGLGFHPRDALFRMGRVEAVRVVGDAARPSDIPRCPPEGTICPCAGVTVADLEQIWARGFHEMELVKRATLAGTGTCQGSVCLPYLRSFLAAKGEVLQPPFTARPVTRQLTLGEIAAGANHPPTARTALDGEHRRLGAQMERSAGWWRPWHYGDIWAEYWAVREGVSIMDVSTLGKMVVSGPDALELLQRLYPTNVATIRTGRARYVLMLDERGYVFDDGLIARESDTRFSLTFTSGGSSHAEMWIRDWAASWGLDVRLLNQTAALGAINVTGPLAGALLARAGLPALPRYLAHTRGEVAGVAGHIFRLSFTGELSVELHHAAADSVRLWRALLDLGRDLGIRPHGLDALLRLRLEKGHIIVGQDTDYDSTPRRIQHEWAVKMDKRFFIGQGALRRTDRIPLDRQLVGLAMDGPAPPEGVSIWRDDAYAGYVTSSTTSPALGKAVMLGWLYLADGALPKAVTIDGRPARRVALPFYDPDGTRAR